MVGIKRVGWAVCGLVAMACGSDALNRDDSNGPAAQAGTKSIIPDGSTAGGAGEGGRSSRAELAGEGGMAGEGSMAGALMDGGSGEDPYYCGGCSQDFVVRCTGRDVFVDRNDVADFATPEKVCAAARAQTRGAGGDGAGGDGAGGDGAGGDGAGGDGAINPGRCATYQVPATVYEDVGICIGRTEEYRRGECVLDDECCVVTLVQFCYP